MLLRDDMPVAAEPDVRASNAERDSACAARRPGSRNSGSSDAERAREQDSIADGGHNQRTVQRDLERSRVRDNPERNDDNLPGLCRFDGIAAAESRQDGDECADSELRHERRRSAGPGNTVVERDAGEPEPDPGNAG